LLSDDRLAKLVSEGNERAFGTLYGRFHQPLYRYCHSMLRHEADAQDALQSTFASALVALRRGQRDAPVRPWLFRIAHNESISLFRKRRPTGELSETLEAPTLSVEAAADERQRLSQLVADLQELPERQRGALVMRELNGLSHEELAQALGISVGAAKQTVFEARRALAEFEEGRALACEQIQRVISDGDRRALRGRRVRAHLRECSACSAFSTAIPQRRTALLALSPALPAATAAGLFTRVTGASSAHHGGGGLLAGAGGKGAGGIGAAVSSKALVTGVAIVATAAAGTAGIVKVVGSSGHRPEAVAVHRDASPSKGSGSSASSTNSLRNASSSSTASVVGSATAGRIAHTKNSANGTTGGATRPGSPAGAHGAGASSITPRIGYPSSTGATSGSPGNSTGQTGSGTNPNSHGGNPNAGGTNSGSSSSNPNAHGGNPNAQGGNAHGGGSTNAHGGNPNAGGGNSGSGSSNAHGGNPNAGGGSTNAGGGTSGLGSNNPNVHGGNPNAGGATSGLGSGSTNAHGGNPNAGGANSHGQGHG
jgi:RNA polymerase sigma factor (sigma-70 family)